MGFESLSTIVVLVIAIIMLVVWVPARTANSMKRASEHRQDRYSSSLHLVREADGSRFGDVGTRQTKGAAMPAQASNTVRLTPERIAHVRALRHAAVRRRRILAIALLAITIVVFAVSFAAHYSPLFALIPFALLAAVLILGANASRHARAWERRVARMREGERKAAAAKPKPASSPASAQSKTVVDDARTREMERREIRRVLHDAAEEKARSLRMKVVAATSGSESVDHGGDAQSRTSSHEGIDADAVGETTVKSAVVAERPDAQAITVHDDASDLTAEMTLVHPASASDAFGMAASQDLISFSLGGSSDMRSEAKDAETEPQSLEIKSMKQVTKVEPVEPVEAERLAREAHAVHLADAADFHKREASADVEAPAATSDSLGVGLESILANRAA